MRRVLLAAFVTAATTFAAVGVSADPLDAMAAKLAALRSEVEALSAKVEESKQTRRAEQRSFAAQKADLEFQLQREQRRVAQLDGQSAKQRERIEAATGSGVELVPAIESSMRELRQRIHDGLPFKTTERLAQVDELEQKLGAGLVSPQKAAVQLWALVEDELRLGRENGLYRQVITLDGEELLVDVARLGMVAMYFQTDDERTGWVTRDADGWRWTVTTNEAERREIALLFDALQKQIRSGWFALPREGGLK